MSARVSVKLTGDWGRVDRGLHRLAYDVTPLVEGSVYHAARRSAKRLRENIKAQAYAHAPLSEEYAARKETEGLDPRTLIAEGKYVEAIQEIRLAPKQWAIGVTDDELARIGAALEYGSEDGTLPARPHWRVELEQLRTDVRQDVHNAMRRVLYAIMRGP